MEAHAALWRTKRPWKPDGALWNLMKLYETSRSPTKPYEASWHPMGPKKFLWNPIKTLETLSLRSPMEPHEILWNPMQPCEALWNLMKPHGALRNPMEPYGTLGNFKKSYGSQWSPMKHCAAPWNNIDPHETQCIFMKLAAEPLYCPVSMSLQYHFLKNQFPIACPNISPYLWWRYVMWQFKFQISIGQGWGTVVPFCPSEPSRPSPAT